MGRLVWCGLLLFGVMAAVAVRGQNAPMRVSGGVMAKQIVERTNPIYPPIAKAARVSGAVVLRAIVDETGHVANLHVVSGPEMLRASALEAVRGWVYRPYLFNGVATAVDTVVTVNFQLAAGIDGEGKDGLGRDVTSGLEVLSDSNTKPKVIPLEMANAFCGSTNASDAGYHQQISSAAMKGLWVERVDSVYSPVDGPRAGTVEAQVCVDAMGAVEKVRVRLGPDALRDEAEKAVSKWTYKPYVINGVAVPVSSTIWVMSLR